MQIIFVRRHDHQTAFVYQYRQSYAHGQFHRASNYGLHNISFD